MTDKRWEIWIDVGGTFTDCLAKSPSGEILRHKLLSSGITKGTISSASQGEVLIDSARTSDPENFWAGFDSKFYDSQGNQKAFAKVTHFELATGSLCLDREISWESVAHYELSCDLDAPIIGARYMLGLPLTEEVSPLNLRLGTTKGTNALLTRAGAKVALVTTQGHGDFLKIGYQDRPRLFDLTICKPSPLTETVLEIEERVTANGKVLASPDDRKVRSGLQDLHEAGIKSLAICFLHADLHPSHEQQVARIAREIGFEHISLSSQVAPLPKFVARGETTVVDAYLSPILAGYVRRLQDGLPGSQIRLMTSNGGLVAAEAFRGYQSILSGPAGGVVGFAKAAQAAGYQRAIGFDMGGTSTDVSRFDALKSGGEFEFEFESRKADVRLMTPTLAINTVAAGGGSICRFDGTKLVVGPESAGADPGPACYGRCGPLTVTDLNFYLGHIIAEHFPFELHIAAVDRHLDQIIMQIEASNGETLTKPQLAEGLLAIANANMARAVRSVSISKGENPEEHLLVSFGGAGAQHACAVAEELGMKEILIHPDAGILSAYGIGHADIKRNAAVGIGKNLKEISIHELEEIYSQLETPPKQELMNEVLSENQIELIWTLDVRYVGTDASIHLHYSPDNIQSDFESQHLREYGYVQSAGQIEIVALRVEAVGKTAQSIPQSTRCDATKPITDKFVSSHFAGELQKAPLYRRTDLKPGNIFTGPAIVAEEHSTIVVEPGWQSEMLSQGELLLTYLDANSQPIKQASSKAVELELFNNLFAGIAEQMGHVLQRTACSVNVKERLDYSCAVFTKSGELIANAPHVPVHLGAMGTTVRAILEENQDMRPGDIYVTNDPYRGGSHLPDVTVVTPVHDVSTGDLLFFTACRAHHAEIGGMRPGSMPPGSKNLAEEGVLITNFALVKDSVSNENALEQLLSQGPYPSRKVKENLADVRAQVAANQMGAKELLKLVAKYGFEKVAENMEGIQDAAETKVRLALQNLEIEECCFTDFLEKADGESIPIKVTITFSKDANKPAAKIDFTGTATAVADNLNANPAIVHAATMYVLRLLVDEDIPLNEGVLHAVEIFIPPGLLNPPQGENANSSPAVAAGNVETSQRIVDVLLGALGIAGASQGTMNNLLFGNEDFGYYETICGGSGATAAGDGADAVQVHMTNTRCTDPEILERRHPVLLHEFSIRNNSGGEGMHRGGDGATRRIEFLDSLEVSLITQRRGPHPPYGAKGGMPGQLGENILSSPEGARRRLPGTFQTTVSRGDQLQIKTPGGGGFGKPKASK